MIRCMGCMEEIDDSVSVCPHCGFVKGTNAVEAIHMQPGSRLVDRYIVGKVLGYGGFGVTYIGWDTKLEQKVAIKEYMPTEFSTRMPGRTQLTVFEGVKHEQFDAGMKKFIEEARKLAKFQSEEGIVRVFDSFEANETAYIIMEYLDGETLSQYLNENGTVPEDMAITMMLPVMESLKRVHEKGILHRDIAPDNIFITKEGQFKLIDFGAARYSTTTASRSLTVIVKPGYSPEEQYRSRGDQGPHTDVYSLSATLYKMITGKTPPDAMERRAKYENNNKDILVEPHKFVKKISLNRENAILNALNVRVEDRTPNVQAFMDELTSEEPVKRVYGKIKKIDLYRWPLWAKVALPSFLGATLVFLVLMFTGIIKFSRFSEEIVIPDGIVQVPDVEDMNISDAKQILEDSGLLVYYGNAVETEYVAENMVVRQDPLSGYYVQRGGDIVLSAAYGKVVKAENGYSTVPYVMNMTLEEAVSRLEEAGMADPDVEEVSDENVVEGLICNQSVESGTLVAEGTKITVYVSTGSAPFAMPDVYGMTSEEAYDVLESAGLKVSSTFIHDDNVDYGCVAMQSIEAGESVKKGTTVLIGICSKDATVTVPNVVGLTVAEAEKILEAEKFEVTVLENYDKKVEQGIVISQTPDAGTQQSDNATVTIIVSKGKQSIEVHFDGNGGKADNNSITEYYGDVYSSLPGASRHGYDFAGWYTSASGGKKISNGDEVTQNSDCTLYARWNEKSYTWSEWSETLPAGTDSEDYESKTQYKYVETTTSSSSTLDGWGTPISKNVSGYGEWSEYTETPIAASDGVEVESKQQYRYRTRQVALESTVVTVGVDAEPNQKYLDLGYNYTTSLVMGGTKRCYNYWRYVYKEWSEWGDWTDTQRTDIVTEAKPTGSQVLEETQEETRTVYRLRNIYYEYGYQRDTDWQDSGSGTVDATRTVYRYKIYN